MLRKLLSILLVCALVAGAVAPSAAAASGTRDTNVEPTAVDADAGWFATNNTTTTSNNTTTTSNNTTTTSNNTTTTTTTESTSDSNASNGTVTVTVGQQLTTIVSQTDSEVRTEVEESAFDVRFEEGEDDERADAISERAEELSERAEDIREEYEDATEAYNSGDISRSEYAQRIATLNARSEHLAQSVARLQTRVTNVSNTSLQTAGFDESELDSINDSLESVSGTGAKALLQRFTGLNEGEVELEADDGLSISVESEDGEVSREIEREHDDDNTTFSLDQSAALDIARDELGTPANGSWSLVESDRHTESGYYEFDFELTGANSTGDAEVRVDGSSGTVFRLESEIDSPDDEEDHEDDRAADETEEDDEKHDEEDDQEEADETEEDHEDDEQADETEEDDHEDDDKAAEDDEESDDETDEAEESDDEESDDKEETDDTETDELDDETDTPESD